MEAPVSHSYTHTYEHVYTHTRSNIDVGVSLVQACCNIDVGVVCVALVFSVFSNHGTALFCVGVVILVLIVCFYCLLCYIAFVFVLQLPQFIQ